MKKVIISPFSANVETSEAQLLPKLCSIYLKKTLEIIMDSATKCFLAG